MGIDLAILPGLFAARLEQRPQAAPVKGGFASRDAAEIEHRGRDVDVRGDAVHFAPRFGRAGKINEERHARAAFIDAAFAGAESAVEAVRLRSVVGEEKRKKGFARLRSTNARASVVKASVT
jgi:hypothetical protein